MKLIKISIITIILWIFLLSLSVYIYNKIWWVDKTDCMIQYINNYYPNWCTYNVKWLRWDDSPHIDKCWLENEYMELTWQIEWCWINDSFKSFIFNTPYCFISLTWEKIHENFIDWKGN